ncbi:MAG: hypothetical protein OEZ43_18435 [Gammaproteobacteria bacterium]|nr:hypothetical protein [Gammaproteobacteria bacterium]
MYYKIKFVVVFFFVAVLGCFHSESDTDLPSTSFPQKWTDYAFSDFSLSDEYVYWETRLGEVIGDESGRNEPDLVLGSFDLATFNNLSDVQKLALSNADSEIGFAAQCLPGYCPVYGVAIKGDTAVVISTKEELLAFLGEIDSTAELAVWLWANEYSAKFYKLTDAGYEVIVAWDTHCQLKGEDLVFVDKAGVITKQRMISTESYESCA